MLKKLWHLPAMAKLAILLLVLSVLVDFASSVLSIAFDAVFIGLALWAFLSTVKEPGK